MVLRPFFFAFLLLGCAEVERDNPQDPNNVDGKMYSTTVINGKRWMRENLNHDVSGSRCYDDEPSNCDRYGRLYKWSAAKDACPGSWRLPNDTEMPSLSRSGQLGGWWTDDAVGFSYAGRYGFWWSSDGSSWNVNGKERSNANGYGNNYYLSVRCIKDLKEDL